MSGRVMFQDANAMRWVIRDLLARSSRPGYNDSEMKVALDQWLEKARQMGIKTIICLLSKSELEAYYASAGIDLLQCYQNSGYHVRHVPVKDYQEPPLNAGEV